MTHRPIGILTHHLAFDEALWRTMEALLELLSSHRAIHFPQLDAVWRSGKCVIEL